MYALITVTILLYIQTCVCAICIYTYTLYFSYSIHICIYTCTYTQQIVLSAYIINCLFINLLAHSFLSQHSDAHTLLHFHLSSFIIIIINHAFNRGWLLATVFRSESRKKVSVRQCDPLPHIISLKISGVEFIFAIVHRGSY